MLEDAECEVPSSLLVALKIVFQHKASEMSNLSRGEKGQNKELGSFGREREVFISFCVVAGTSFGCSPPLKSLSMYVLADLLKMLELGKLCILL